jgi:hypothetical protein
LENHDVLGEHVDVKDKDSRKAKYKPKVLSQYNNSKHEEGSILKEKLEWLLLEDKELETLEARLEARKELRRVKRPSLLPLYILSN